MQEGHSGLPWVPEEAHETLMGETPSICPEKESTLTSEMRRTKDSAALGLPRLPTALSSQPLTQLSQDTLLFSRAPPGLPVRSGHHDGDQVHSARPSVPWTRLREASSSASSPQLLLPALGLPDGAARRSPGTQSGLGRVRPCGQWWLDSGRSPSPPGHLGSQF